MLAKLKAMFQNSLCESADSGQLDALSENLITATLMVEVMNRSLLRFLLKHLDSTRKRPMNYAL